MFSFRKLRSLLSMIISFRRIFRNRGDAIQGAATAQGGVELAVDESAGAKVQFYFVERKPLAFMDCDGPCMFEWKLLKGTHHLRGDFTFQFIPFILFVFPDFFLDVVHLAIRQLDDYRARRYIQHPGQGAVDPPFSVCDSSRCVSSSPARYV